MWKLTRQLSGEQGPPYRVALHSRLLHKATGENESADLLQNLVQDPISPSFANMPQSLDLAEGLVVQDHRRSSWCLRKKYSQPSQGWHLENSCLGVLAGRQGNREESLN